MAAPHQNIADIVVLKTAAPEPDFGDLNLNTEAPVGLKLAACRKAKGLTHEEVHAGTKIKIVHIAAIEAGDRTALPATPFTAGFVKAYAQFLGLDADGFARTYKREAGFAPLAAPVQAAAAAIMEAKAQVRADAPAEPEAAEPVAAAPAIIASTALVPMISPPAAPAPEPSIVEAARAASRKAPEPDKMATWLGAGAAIAVVAFMAGRAVQPAEVTSQIASPASVLAETAAIEARAAQDAANAAIAAAAARDAQALALAAIETPPSLAALKEQPIKPKPKKRPVQETAPAAERAPATPAPVMTAAPAAPAPVRSEPKIVPARVTRGASPQYPERCAARAADKVAVSVVFSITTEGRPVSASVASTQDRCFNTAATRAVYDMRFTPRTVDGAAAVETAKTVTVRFVR